jgi:nanoRNase/pAp phosphatase (c-di-AMP/oligoRNAs hydrolase)
MVFSFLRSSFGSILATARTGKRWSAKTLVVGPFEPVDGDSVACTKAIIHFLRRYGLEAYTIPTLSMYSQLEWILERSDFHPSESFPNNARRFLTDSLQNSYDKLLRLWIPDEIVLVDGQRDRLGFDPKGVRVYCIDHHTLRENSNDEGSLIRSAPSAGCILIDTLNILEPILAVSILTDTFWLRYNQPSSALKSFARLTQHGLTDALLAEYQQKLMVKKDSQILETLRTADMRFFDEGRAVFVVLTDPNPEIHRGVLGELGYFCQHICVVRGDGYVSMKTGSPDLDLKSLAIKYGGGGHNEMAALKLESASPDSVEAVYRDFTRLVTSLGTGVPNYAPKT